MRDKRSPRRLVVALWGLLLGSQAAAAGQVLPDVTVDVISSRVYASAVDAYAEGRHGEAMARLARVVPAAVYETASATLSSWPPDGALERRLRAAAVLHLDTGFQLVQRYRAEAVDPHLRAADLALDRLEKTGPSANTETFRAQGAIVRLHHLTVAGRHDELDRSVASLKVPESMQIEVLFARAVSHETRARATPPRVDRRPTRATAPLSSATFAGARRVWLENHLRYATDLYRQVLAREPDAPEARLRLARVLLEGGAADAALETLEPLTVDGCDEDVCALAWLARGEALEARGAPADAREAYTHAARAASVRGSATVALLTLDASVAPSPLAAQPPGVADDSNGAYPPAWRGYLLGITHRQADLMSMLRQAVR